MAAPNTITTSDGSFEYTLTDEDMGWLARELAHEGGSDAATLWCMAQRLYALRGHFTSMTSMVRNFSEPINPKFLANGDFCRPGGRDADLPRCKPEITARRAVWQSSPPPADKLAFVKSWARGEVPNPVPRAIDFRACDQAADDLVASGRATLVLAAGNCYVARDGSEDWPDDQVLVAGTGTDKSGSHIGAFLAVLALAGLAAGGVWLYREHVL